jgi:hypothetical protein
MFLIFFFNFTPLYYFFFGFSSDTWIHEFKLLSPYLYYYILKHKNTYNNYFIHISNGYYACGYYIATLSALKCEEQIQNKNTA